MQTAKSQKNEVEKIGCYLSVCEREGFAGCRSLLKSFRNLAANDHPKGKLWALKNHRSGAHFKLLLASKQIANF